MNNDQVERTSERAFKSRRNRKRETNEEFMKRIMTFCPTGAMSQMFIMDAIAQHADRVSTAPPVEHPLIDGDAWKRTATWIAAELEAHFKR
jgi:hypothetical protein